MDGFHITLAWCATQYRPIFEELADRHIVLLVHSSPGLSNGISTLRTDKKVRKCVRPCRHRCSLYDLLVRSIHWGGSVG